MNMVYQCVCVCVCVCACVCVRACAHVLALGPLTSLVLLTKPLYVCVHVPRIHKHIHIHTHVYVTHVHIHMRHGVA
jgi:hypothetical protein